jgi:hypothetical protein
LPTARISCVSAQAPDELLYVFGLNLISYKTSLLNFHIKMEDGILSIERLVILSVSKGKISNVKWTKSPVHRQLMVFNMLAKVLEIEDLAYDERQREMCRIINDPMF